MDKQLAARQQLQESVTQDIRERVAIHKENISRLQSAKVGAQNFAVEIKNKPLVLFACGDSWFDYPLHGNGPLLGDTDIIAQLRKIGSMPPTILNLAVAGDTSVSEMSLKRQTEIIKQLSDKSNWIDSQPDAILFSAGGNDIAGEEFCIFLDFNDGKSVGLNMERFTKALGMVEACYLNLFTIRDRIVPGVLIIGHCYDFPIPNGSHPICAGPWLKPSLDFCNWSVTDGTKIVHEALAEFRNMLKRLESNPKNNFHLVETQGTFKPEDWANELHPYPDGFKVMATKFANDLDKLLRTTLSSLPVKKKSVNR
ncbi:SGNH/GDSL hydrolase family protein [Citrobacter freundii]|uniref:SGNH/GDSL hydrolase family protein n=1 Tax=Citrobacter freundii TaxID=546 RepID=UPI0015E56393|nr:SGNH/GDSL hydrolase family protein [Citrobacter freundii]QLO43160.1 SGNH/GDSL hydrolase family protein [Citrobacter freundii]QLV41324.1 SGNH/GDSL hydrolase family protein [Citrobacter freundii]